MENPGKEPDIKLEQIFGLVTTIAFGIVALDRIVSYVEKTYPIISDSTAAFITTIAVFYGSGIMLKSVIRGIFDRFGYHNYNYWDIGADGEIAAEVREKDPRYTLPPEQRRQNRGKKVEKNDPKK